jgi:beta-N-acetylhexosaminidase
MKAIADRYGIDDAAVRAIDAGCDAVLVCASEEMQAKVVEALVHRAETDGAFDARCREAFERGIAMRRRVPPRPVNDRAAFLRASERAERVATRIAAGAQ